MTHIYVSKITIIGSDNGLPPRRHQAIIWTSVGILLILLIGPLGTDFSEILIEMYTFLFKKRHLKMSSGKWRPFYLGLNVLNGRDISTHWGRVTHICVSKPIIIGSDNGFWPGRRQAIIWTSAAIANSNLRNKLQWNFYRNTFYRNSFKKMHLKILPAKWWQFCIGLNVLTHWGRVTHICVDDLTIIGSDNGAKPLSKPMMKYC